MIYLKRIIKKLNKYIKDKNKRKYKSQYLKKKYYFKYILKRSQKLIKKSLLPINQINLSSSKKNLKIN